MRSSKKEHACTARRKAAPFSFLLSLVLVMGLMPNVAFADGQYPDTNAPVRTSSGEVDVGNVSVDTQAMAGNFNRAVFAAAGESADASINVHGDIAVTGVDNGLAISVTAKSTGGTAVVNAEGDVVSNVTSTQEEPAKVSEVDGLEAFATTPGAQARVNVAGNVSSSISSTDIGNVSSFGIYQISYTPTAQSSQAVSSVVVNGNVAAESPSKRSEASGIDANADKASATTTIVRGGVSAVASSATGVRVTMNSRSTSVLDVGTVSDVSVGQSITATSSSSNGFATGVSAFNNGGTAIVCVGGDVVAAVKGGGGQAIGVEATTSGGLTSILVQGIIRAKTAGILSAGQGNQPAVMVWKIESDLVAGKWKLPKAGSLSTQADGAGGALTHVPRPDGEGAVLPESYRPVSEGLTIIADEAMEKAINYIIKLEQPKEGNILKLVGAKRKSVTSNGETFSFDVAKMGDKVYLGVDDGWVITAAFNGLGERLALAKDDDGWFVIVPKGGGVYLSALVEREKGDDPGNNGGNPVIRPVAPASNTLPQVGDSHAGLDAALALAVAGLALAFLAAKRMAPTMGGRKK